jgi:hypothetical protein
MNYKLNFTLIYAYIPILIIISQFILNPIGHRFPDQDLMWHDQVSLSRIEFFLHSLKNNIFSVINFSEGFGVDIRSNIKTQLPILDLSLFLSLFLKVNHAITLKLIIYSIIGYISTYKLLSQNSLCIKSWFFSILFVLGILFFGESSTLTTINYALTPFLLLFMEKYKNNKSSINLFYLQLVTIFFISNLDLNAVFIMPLIFIWFINGNLFNCFKKDYFLVGLIFLVSFCLIQSSTIYYLLTTQTEYVSNNLNFLGFNEAVIHFKNIIKTAFVPYVNGPMTMYIFPPIFAFLLLKDMNKNEYINITLIFFTSMFFYFSPVILPFLKIYIPSLVRYHFTVTAILIFISLSKVYLKNDLLNKNNFFPKKSFLFFIVLADLWILLYCHSLLVGVLCCLFFTFCSLVFLASKEKINNFFKLIFPLSQIGFIFCVFNGGSITNNYRSIDKEYGYYYNSNLNKCIGKYVKGSGIITVAEHPLFPDAGRHDLLLPVLERPSDLIGRSFYQWRHSYPKITSDLYVSSGAKGAQSRTNFFPPAKTATSKPEFWNFVEITQSKYIASININLNNKEWRVIGKCQSKKHLEFDETMPDYKKSLYKSFSDIILIHERINNKFETIKYTPTYLELRLEKNINLSEIKIPILYSTDLITNFPKTIKIEKSKDFFTVLKFKKTHEINNKLIKISSYNSFILLPYYLLFVLVVLNLIFNMIYIKKLRP